jgi:hypothetical protein
MAKSTHSEASGAGCVKAHTLKATPVAMIDNTKAQAREGMPVTPLSTLRLNTDNFTELQKVVL